MWAAILEFLKGIWNGPKEKIGPVIDGYNGVMSEWRQLYAAVQQTLAAVEEELKECREDRAQLNARVDVLEAVTKTE